MRSRFFHGVLLGGMAGLLAAIYYAPRLKSPRRYLMGNTRRIGKKTGKMVSSVAREVQDFIRR
ncbi:MAG: YtxH domain-containing protein [Clostridia bacterium]|jgi:gas vesicle protein|nr:YtxH domain-containing protein [Clostridia bacterium]